MRKIFVDHAHFSITLAAEPGSRYIERACKFPDCNSNKIPKVMQSHISYASKLGVSGGSNELNELPLDLPVISVL